MENRNMRELNLEEMDKITGGIHDAKESRRYEIFDGVQCPHCGRSFNSGEELQNHIKLVHS